MAQSGKNTSKRQAPSKGNRSGQSSGNKGNQRGGRQGWTPPPKSNTPLISGIVGGVVVVAAVVILIIISISSSSPPNSADQPASAQLVNAVTQVPSSIYDQVGTGSGQVIGAPTTISGSSLTLNGKPEFLYMGAEYCPFCGADRWAIVAALSRFGTFSGLQIGASSATDTYPSTPTFGFYKASYTSKYLSFVSVEMQDVNHNPLQNPTSQESSIMNKYDPKGSIPFLDVANKWMDSTIYSPQVLQGLTHDTIAATLSTPTNPTAQAILGGANYLSATICAVDGQQPVSVCSSSGVKAAETSLGHGATTAPGQHSSTPSSTKG
ncbi:MAG: DUF929 family protein [Acidimicrobiales bacterium]|nr:DUF929 family protein [Acidimicrobiales bacterium]